MVNCLFLSIFLLHGVHSLTIIRAFVRSTLLSTIKWYLLIDMLHYPLSSFSRTRVPNLWDETPSRRLAFAYLNSTNTFCMFHLYHCIASGITVALGIYPPETWPPIMGKVKDVFCVRDFWGKLWHQILRRVCYPLSPFSSLSPKL